MGPHPSLRDSWQLVAVGEVPVIFCQRCSLFYSGVALFLQCMTSHSGLAK